MTDSNITAAAPQTPAPEAERETRAAARPVFRPLADIAENETALTLNVEMPGVDRDGVEVELEKRVLTIRGTRAGRDPEGWRLVHREYESGDYLRVFTLSSSVDADNISAAMRDGVLTLTLPKVAPQGPKKIAVSAA